MPPKRTRDQDRKRWQRYLRFEHIQVREEEFESGKDTERQSDAPGCRDPRKCQPFM